MHRYKDIIKRYNQSMKIGLNGQMLTRSGLAGPEQFALHLYTKLSEIDKTNDYIVYFENEPNKDLITKLFTNKNNITYKVLPKLISWTQISLLLELMTNRVDVFFTPFHTVPSISRFFQKTVCMLHGFEYKINNQYSKKPIHKLLHPFVLWWTLLTSHKIIVPSNKVKTEINYLFINKSKIDVIPEAVGEEFYKRNESEIDTIRNKYNINGKYLFFLSTIQPRKNVPRMVEAVKSIPEIKLVIAGKLGWEYDESVNSMNANKDKVIYIGRIPDEDRPALYSGAEAFINCSLDEGFGLPLLEAISCGTKAIVSNIPAFNEIGEEYPVYVNPLDINNISQGIHEALSQPMALQRAQEIAKKYSWNQTAKKFLEVFTTD